VTNTLTSEQFDSQIIEFVNQHKALVDELSNLDRDLFNKIAKLGRVE
jgi:hypothetical protein